MENMNISEGDKIREHYKVNKKAITGNYEYC